MRATEGSRPENQAGFTLVEVIVAILILSVGILGLAATTGWVVRQSTLSRVTEDRGAALQAAVETIKSTPYTSLGNGSLSIGAFQESWSVSNTGSRYTEMEIVSTGPGLGSAGGGLPTVTRSVVDTFTYRLVRP